MSDMGWGSWWDADARLAEVELERALRAGQDLIGPPREHRLVPLAVPEPEPVRTAPVPADDLHERVTAWAAGEGGKVPSLARIRDEYGVGTGRAQKLQDHARERLAQQ